MERQSRDGEKRSGDEFDPDLTPENVHNQNAAYKEGLHFDPKKRMYCDADGCLIRDRFGQPL